MIMKNKSIKVLVVLFMLATLLILAKPNNKKNADDIPNRTYIIGTYEFTSKIALTKDNIDIAMKTTKDDTTIYYKNPYGEWINADTGEFIKAPKSFKITHVDLIER